MKLMKAINHISLKHSDADKIVITGDLTDGDKSSYYNKLKNILY